MTNEITPAEQSAWQAGVDAGREMERQNAAVAQEPAGTVRWRNATPTVEWNGRPPDEGTEVYAAPVTDQAQPLPKCPFPCGWDGLHSIAVKDAAYLAKIQWPEDEEGVSVPRATMMRNMDYLIQVCRAMLNAKAEVHAQQPVSGADGLDAIRAEMIADTREVFDANGSETPQSVRDVIEYVDFWLSVFAQKQADSQGETAQPQPSGNAGELPDEVRVPLDSLYADAGYLIGRLNDGSLTPDGVVAVIRSCIEEARAALAALASGQDRGDTDWDADDQRELKSIGKAVNRAAADLPEGLDIRIDIENGSGTVYWRNRAIESPEGLWRMIDMSGEPFSNHINAAIEAARAAAKGKASP